MTHLHESLKRQQKTGKHDKDCSTHLEWKYHNVGLLDTLFIFRVYLFTDLSPWGNRCGRGGGGGGLIFTPSSIGTSGPGTEMRCLLSAFAAEISFNQITCKSDYENFNFQCLLQKLVVLL